MNFHQEGYCVTRDGIKLYRSKLDHWTIFWKRDSVTCPFRSTLWSKPKCKSTQECSTQSTSVRKDIEGRVTASNLAKYRPFFQLTRCDRANGLVDYGIKYRPIFQLTWRERANSLNYYGSLSTVRLLRDKHQVYILQYPRACTHCQFKAGYTALVECGKSWFCVGCRIGYYNEAKGRRETKTRKSESRGKARVEILGEQRPKTTRRRQPWN